MPLEFNRACGKVVSSGCSDSAGAQGPHLDVRDCYLFMALECHHPPRFPAQAGSSLRLPTNSPCRGNRSTRGGLQPGRVSVLGASTLFRPSAGQGNLAMIHPPEKIYPIRRHQSRRLLHPPNKIPGLSAVSHYPPRFVRAQSIRHRPRPNGAQTRRFAGVARAVFSLPPAGP